MSAVTTRILKGHVLDRLRELPDESVHCCVTSPPYFGLRDYGLEPQVWDDGWRGSLGLEPTPQLYIEHLITIFREVHRVLRKDGTFWLNIGDSYAMSTKGAGGKGKQHTNVGSVLSDRTWHISSGTKPKDLLGIPWMLAFALRDDGWYLRSEITWAKAAPMPESVTDRPTSATEKVFLLTKSGQYFYDNEAVKEPASTTGTENLQASTRNMRNWWLLNPEPLKDKHFAAFPSEIPKRAILAGTSERGVCAQCGAPWKQVVEKTEGSARDASEYAAGLGDVPIARTRTRSGSVNGQTIATNWQPTCSCNADTVPATVLDPFIGSGTTGLVAGKLQRNCIGIDLNPEYTAMGQDRIGDVGLLYRAVIE